LSCEGTAVHIAIGEHLLSGSAADRFDAAREAGVDGIELGFGPYDGEHHPLLQPGQPASLRSQARAAGLSISSVYAGYFHDHALSHPDGDTRRRHAQVLDRLLAAAAEAGARVVVLPLFGAADVREPDAIRRLIDTLGPLADKATGSELLLGLETTLPAAALLAETRHPAVRVAYDLGNAVVLGYDAVADVKLLGHAVGQVRVKDCTPDDRRLPLGRGGVPFAAVAGLPAGLRAWWVLEAGTGEDRLAQARADVAFLRGLCPET
jgi:sugar phosphate isomerase/epimerase